MSEKKEDGDTRWPGVFIVRLSTGERYDSGCCLLAEYAYTLESDSASSRNRESCACIDDENFISIEKFVGYAR